MPQSAPEEAGSEAWANRKVEVQVDGTHSFLHRVTEGFLEGGHVVGHVRWVGELGGTMHEVVHGCPSGIPMGEVKVAMTLVVVSWDGKKMEMGKRSPRGKVATLS